MIFLSISPPPSLFVLCMAVHVCVSMSSARFLFLFIFVLPVLAIDSTWMWLIIIQGEWGDHLYVHVETIGWSRMRTKAWGVVLGLKSFIIIHQIYLASFLYYTPYLQLY